MIKIQQYDYPWNAESFIKHLQVFGFTLIAVSMLYLVAANWFMLPQNIQLAIPQLLLLFSAVCSLWLTKHDFLVQCLHSICGLMIGLSLAVIGQIYQTGADELFIISILVCAAFTVVISSEYRCIFPFMYYQPVGTVSVFYTNLLGGSIPRSLFNQYSCICIDSILFLQ